MLRLLVVAGLLACCLAHSWLTCTDYLEENGEYWSSDLCRAFPRHASKFANKDTFGVDTGYNHFGNEGEPCKTPRDDDNAYDSTYRMAVYYPGQRIVLTHPTKNHVAETCTNMWIPDNGMELYMSGKSGDVKMSEYKANPIWDFGKSPNGQNNGRLVDAKLLSTYPKPGFQNAPKFCENMDKALATMTFELPSDIKPGRYSFLWSWWFNSAKDEYTGCYEADVVASKAERDAILQQRGQTTNEPVNIYGKTNGGNPKTVAPPAVTTATHTKTVAPPVVTTATNPKTVAPSMGTIKPPVKVDGGWGAYSTWSQCSVSCGGGQQRRVRHCNSPMPQNGGDMCYGNDEEIQACNTPDCPKTGGVTFKDLKVVFTSDWGRGANGLIVLPSNKPDDVSIVLEFPCPPVDLHEWNSVNVSPPDEMARGIYTLKQTEQWMKQKPDIGFTVQFGSCTVRSTDVKINARLG